MSKERLGRAKGCLKPRELATAGLVASLAAGIKTRPVTAGMAPNQTPPPSPVPALSSLVAKSGVRRERPEKGL